MMAPVDDASKVISPDNDITFGQAVLTEAAQVIYLDIHACQNPDQLDVVGRLLWEQYGAGLIGDDEASYLSGCIERRRPLSRRTSAGKFAVVTKTSRISRFLPRERQCSPDRKASRDRRRMLGGSSALPDGLRQHYSEAHRAVLCVVAGEIKKHGVCDLPIDAIAARAGAGRSSTQNALHQARRLGHITVVERPVQGRKNLTNLIRICSRSWRAWLKRSPKKPEDPGKSNRVQFRDFSEPHEERRKKERGHQRRKKSEIEVSP